MGVRNRSSRVWEEDWRVVLSQRSNTENAYTTQQGSISMPAAIGGRSRQVLLAAGALIVASCLKQVSALVSLPSSPRAGPPPSAVAAPAAAPATVSRHLPAAAVVGPLRSSTGTEPAPSTIATTQGTSHEVVKDLRTIQEYLNNKHGELLEKFALTFTPTGEEMSKKNFWRGCVLWCVCGLCQGAEWDGQPNPMVR